MFKSVCYFGSYDPDYARNRIIIKGLRANGIKVFHCQASGLIIFRYIKLINLFWKYKNELKSVIVGFPGHYDVPLAFLLGKIFKKKVFYDIFASTYETYVLDREVVKKNSFRSKFFYLLDWLGLKLADYVIIDTLAHGRFYDKLYGLNSKKQILIYVGSDTDYFYPRKVKEETDVLFYGSYQPLHGAEYIVRAAEYLPNVKFKLIGDGQTKNQALKIAKEFQLKNVQFVGWVNIAKLAQEINKSKILLGIFSNSKKAQCVIPNKVFDSIACDKPVITADTEAIRELFTKSKNIMLVNGKNPKKLSLAIELLLKNQYSRDRIASGSFNHYDKYLKPELLVKPLLKVIT